MKHSITAIALIVVWIFTRGTVDPATTNHANYEESDPNRTVCCNYYFDHRLTPSRVPKVNN